MKHRTNLSKQKGSTIIVVMMMLLFFNNSWSNGDSNLYDDIEYCDKCAN